LQSFAREVNLGPVKRSAAALCLLASLGSPGCASSELALGGLPVSPSPYGASGLYEVVSFGGAATCTTPSKTSSTREAISSRAEGAAYLANPLSPSSGAEPEQATVAILRSSARCPAEMALVDDRACVDRWEASLVERVTAPTGRGSVERPWSPFLPVEGHEHRVRAVSRPGVIPQAYISGKQAAEACSASGKRLCASDEWERACRGPSNFQFPYGDRRRAGACNDDIRPVHPVTEVGKLLGIPRDRLWQDGMNQSIINQLPNTLLPTGERAECTNEYGIFDMVGNVHEWVDDPDGTFRGGYYMDTTKNGEGCSYHTTAHDFTYHDYSTGFRCCMDPERVE
jgi:sulfatase modifying factor 1